MAIASGVALASIRSLAARLREGEFTSTELTEFFLERLGRLGAQLNAVVTITREAAVSQAKQADKELAAGKDRGPLHGIPFGAKDLLATKGIPTSWGAAPLREQMFDEDATVIRRLREAGAVLCAKLAMVEIAGGFGYRQANASFTGPGLNPWDRTRWSGGSSSGSGAAVGGGLVPFAIGSETWGSIMTPAGYCGVTGLRPTYGRVSRHGAMALSWTLDKLGPICRTADDCGLVLEAIAGADPADPSSSTEPYAYLGDLVPDKLKTGTGTSRSPGISGEHRSLFGASPRFQPKPPFKLAALAGADEHVQEEVRQNYRHALDALREFATIEEVELPALPYNVVAATILSCEMAAAFEEFVTSGDVWELTAEEDHWGLHSSLAIPAKDYINALRIRPKIQQALDDLLSRYDALATPTLATVAPPVDRPFREYSRGFRSPDVGGAGNAAGIPAITVPNGYGEGGLPTGLQLVGRAFEENRLLAVAAAYQKATDWHERVPPL